MNIVKRLRTFLTLCLVLGVMIWLGHGMETKAAIVSTGHQKYSYTEYRKDLQQLQKKYPEYCQVNVIGKSADDRNLYEVILGNAQAKKHLVVIANLHGREYMTTQLCMSQIEYYLKTIIKKSTAQRYLRCSMRWLFIMCLPAIRMERQSVNLGSVRYAIKVFGLPCGRCREVPPGGKPMQEVWI